MEPKKTDAPFKRKDDYGIFIIISLFGLALILGGVVFINYISSVKQVTHALSATQDAAKSLSIEQCAERNIDWYKSCSAMQQICDDTVSRMIKVCLVNGEKSSQCAKYGDKINGYNFGYEECKPYFSKKNMKKACADTWQAIADYCKDRKSVV